MFTFCFTTAAAAQLRRVREIRTSTRPMAAGVRAVKIGLIALSMLAVAGMAQAGGHPSGSMGSSSHSGSSMLSQSNSFKTSQSNSKFDSNKAVNLNKLNDNKPTAIDSLKNSGDKIAKIQNNGNNPIKLTEDRKSVV